MDGMDGNLSDLGFHLARSDRQTQKRAKRLLFDRRYGWIFDEWKDPTEEVFTGGRGMFCVVPIAKAMLKMASQSVDCAVETVTKTVENLDQISPLLLHSALTSQFQNFLDFTRAGKANLPDVSADSLFTVVKSPSSSSP